MEETPVNEDNVNTLGDSSLQTDDVNAIYNSVQLTKSLDLEGDGAINETIKAVTEEVRSLVLSRKSKSTILLQQTTNRMEKFGMDETSEQHIERKLKLSDLKISPIIGIVDSGVNIHHNSFHDKQMTDFIHAPEWKGEKLSVPFNGKVVAVKSSIPMNTPRETSILDVDGHGTMCASIAAASRVNVKCLEGIEGVTNTIICGANPHASIASYKVFGTEKNLEGELFLEVDPEGLLDAIQRAVNDKVGVISISIAAKVTKETSTSYLEDMVNHGTFGAFRENIISCVSAGNDFLSSSLAPWVITVGSCNYGGRFYTTIQLGNGRRLKGFGTFLDRDGNDHEIFFCPECFKPKVIVPPRMDTCVIACDKLECPIIKNLAGPSTIKWAAGILVLGIQMAAGLTHYFRRNIVFLNKNESGFITDYIETRIDGEVPTVKFLQSVYEESSNEICKVSSNSGRGPNLFDAHLLKPDICAPGENLICAARWDPMHLYGDYCIMSGTSAATPMVAGMVSYIRSIHPEWEPGRIKSAIVTTALPMQYDDGNDILGSVSGLINPLRALDPGLVYDLTWDDCRRYLLGRERDKLKLRELRENLEGLAISGENLNLPSFSLVLGEKKTFHRVLTNLGSREEPTIYRGDIKFGIKCPSCIRFSIHPNRLTFNGYGDQKHFALTIDSSSLSKMKMMVVDARLEWVEFAQDPHIVSSPILMIGAGVG
ncbi:hypothetical protein V6N13_031055 [Hibiscus sabdariffa]|uniref:Uncharacterized protein n=1 Tax=Hibiscus sabdariffa TaxID=183260 RepID=A0ABR2CLH9_9ROSI